MNLFVLCVVVYVMMYVVSADVIDLNGEWNVFNKNESIKISGIVPGDIFTDLMRANIVGDPYYRFNDVEYRWVGLDNWSYEKKFDVSQAMIQFDEVLLVCEGLDTVAKISVNGKHVADTNNMFRKYTFPLKSYLFAGENIIRITFMSATVYGTQQEAKYPYPVPTSQYVGGQDGRQFVRKMQSSFGWDWGPSFIPQGIWQPIQIVGFSGSHIEDNSVNVVQDDTKSNWIVNFYADFTSSQKTSGTLVLTLEKFTKQFNINLEKGSSTKHAILSIPVKDVDLWWPNGYGSPVLYDLKITWTENSNTFSTQKKIGFRTVQLVQEKLGKGTSFYFKVNNVPIFAKGANFIPVDSFQGRVSKQNITTILTDSAAVHMNTIRNWGGGIYQVDEFYDTCDELGLMVWEEFMFGCSMYPRDDAFLSNVREEVKYQTKRLMHHPSIIIWSGNNENEAALGWYPETRANRDLYLVDQVVLYVDTLRDALLDIDQSRSFIVSSPSNDALVENPYVLRWGDVSSGDYGDVHYYDYQSMCTDFTKYPVARFVSEYGYQSFPSLHTWAPVTKEEDLRINSTLMQHRQHHPHGTEELLQQMKFHFHVPSNSSGDYEFFKNFVYLSQVQQALCIKSQTEYYRRMKGNTEKTMGALYWQLNQIWQAPSWSSLEYGGRWKILHYFAKHFFADVLITSFETTEKTDSMLNVQIVSDQNKPVSGKFYVDVYTIEGAKVHEFVKDFKVGNLESKTVFSMKVHDLICSSKCFTRNEVFLILRAEDNLGSLLSENTHYLSPLVNSKLPLSKLTVSNFKVTSDKVITFTIESNTISFYTWIESPEAGRFSENGFHLLPNQPRQIIFYSGTKAPLIEVFSESLTTISLSDTLQ